MDPTQKPVELDILLGHTQNQGSNPDNTFVVEVFAVAALENRYFCGIEKYRRNSIQKEPIDYIEVAKKD